MNMFEYEFLCLLNDLFPSGVVSQDWPSAMHDHMSTSFSVSPRSGRRSAVQALCSIFTKRFYCLRIRCKYIFMFVVNLGPSRRLKPQVLLCPPGSPQALFAVLHFIGHWRQSATLLPFCTVAPQSFVCDAIAAKVVCSHTCAQCFIIALIARKVVRSPQVTGARSRRAATSVRFRCDFMCVREPVHVGVSACTYICRHEFKHSFL